MSAEIKLPPPLNEIENTQTECKPICDLSSIDISKLKPYERNRLFTQYSDVRGDVTPDIHNVAESWKNLVNHEEINRAKGTPNVVIQPPKGVPRSHLVDTFFSHQLPGIEDSVLTDVRHLVKLQSQIQRTADLANRQMKLAMYHIGQIAPDQKALENIVAENENPFLSIQRLIEEDEPFKPVHCNSKTMQTAVSVVLENTDNITPDFVNGNYAEAEAPATD